MAPLPELLAADALAGLRVAVSASQSEDLPRLGLVEIHFRLALGEIARSVIVSGGMLAYGGHLDPAGYTAFLLQELHRYSRRDKPLRVYLALPEHRRVALNELKEQKDELGLFGEVIYLDSGGNVIQPHQGRGAGPEPVTNAALTATSLTAMRQYMANDNHARILLGGRRTGFQGVLPGVIEEASISLKRGQPLYLVGGFGGATFDTIQALGVDQGEWFPQAANTAQDTRLKAGLAELRTVASHQGWSGLNNGLSDDENRLLARTPRPSEIAALISLGLGRRFAKK